MPDSKRHLIKLLPNKKAFFCKPDQKVLDAGLEAGIALPHSCRGGNCGRCAANVLVGSYRYDRTTPPPGLTSDQRSAGMALLCQIVPESPLTVEIARSEEAGVSSMPVVKLPCRIVARESVAPDVMKLTLQLPRTQPLDFRPGQYLDVLLDKGMRRSYSLAGLPYSISSVAENSEGDGARRAATHLELHVRRVVGGLFSALAFDPEASSLLRIEGPHGVFGWRPHKGSSLLIAGGTGFAPMKSMLLEAMMRNDGGQVHLFWGGRNSQDLYERAELLQWQEQYDWFSFTPVVENRSADNADLVGRAPEVAFANYTDISDAIVYASGPPGLVQSVLNECSRLGVSEDRIVTDSFDYAV